MFAKPLSQQEVVNLVHTQTTGQVRDLEVEVWPGRVVLRGRASSYYVKQLAQHDLRQRLPAYYALDNLIEVGSCASPKPNYFDSPSGRTRKTLRRSLVVPSRSAAGYVVA